MAEHYIETPRTDAGNATFVNNSLESLSVENSFQVPAKEKNDLITQIRNNRRGLDLNTPRTRAPFADRRNLSAAPVHGEFTPLMKSVTKKNLLRNGQQNGVPQTPAFLKPGHASIVDSPALPAAESSAVYGDETGTSLGGEDEGTPVPQVASSSAQSTPLATLPKRDGGGLLADGANMMTLREQENIINKIEKENFGLKLKIHYLEEALRKSGPGLNEAALKENTELKVTRVTMQKELHRYKKNLGQAEHDLEAYQSQFTDLKDKVKQKHADASLHEELENLKKAIEEKEHIIEELKENLRAVEEQDVEAGKLRDEIEDLQADMGEKDRIIEEREEEIDELKEHANKDSAAVAELEEYLESAQKEVQDLRDKVEHAESEASKAREHRQEARDEKQRAEDDLNEASLRDEMANKSFSTKGLSRQLEDKANRLQTNLDALREEHAQLREKFDDSVRLATRLQDKVDELDKETGMREHKLQDQLELAQHERESARARLEQISDELRNKKEEKDLLQSRHDALTTESQSLQKELRKAQATVKELEANLKDEQRHALDNERAFRSQGKDEIERLTDDIDDIRRELESKESQFAAGQDHWESLRRGLESQREKADAQAAGLKRTIQKLQESEGTLSGREMKLQEALDSERQRHDSEEAVLNRQIQELEGEIDTKRQAFEEARSGLSRVKEELRLTKREEHNLNEKIQGLEDEIEILQSSLDDEVDRTKVDVSAARQEAEGLRRQLHTAKQDLAKAEAAHADARVEIEIFQGDFEAGQGSKEQVSSRLRDVEAQLQKVKTEKQKFQDELANKNMELQTLRASAAEIEAERDEMKILLNQMQGQVDERFRYDQEKIDLRKAKLRLESDAVRLRDERKGLIEKNEAIEKGLEAEIERAGSEEGRLSTEVADLRKRLAVLSDGRDRELNSAKQKVQRLELHVEELENHLQSDNVGDDAAVELSTIRRDLSAARKKETDYLQREASHKETVRDLKHNIADIERQLHEAEITKLVVDSPRSSIGGSARKSEVIEVRRQLAEAHHQMKDLRSKAKEVEREAQRKVAAVERESRARADAFDHDGEVLEQEIADCRLQQEEQLAKNTSAEQNIGRLRTKIQRLEKDLHNARLDQGDRTIAEERKDLHEMLKDAKLEVEDLQMQMSARDAKIQSFASREKELRTQLKRVREERGQQTQRANAATAELETLQRRYERAVDDMARQQQVWEEERKAMNHRVRFPNMSISSLHPGNSTELGRLEEEIQEKEKRHQLELKGLVKQIQYLRAKCFREEEFRLNLAYQKKYFLKQIEMYNACNTADLQILAEMGIKPKLKNRQKKTSLRSVVYMVVAGLRMKKMQVEWSVNKKLRATLAKKLQQVRRNREEALVTE